MLPDQDDNPTRTHGVPLPRNNSGEAGHYATLGCHSEERSDEESALKQMSKSRFLASLGMTSWASPIQTETLYRNGYSERSRKEQMW